MDSEKQTTTFIHLLSAYTMHAPCSGSYLCFKQTITPDSGEMRPLFALFIAIAAPFQTYYV